ncbi:MAG: acetoin utilization protein AcuC [Aquificaceae bacterium]|nr:acetoin utilization protein AcuC [Aquificaceae bacterium]MDW8236781.1 acetoin utilization protein AcuC [Aquificaceae bacterium]
MPRVSVFVDFLLALELLEEGEILEPRVAKEEELLLFHTKDYIQALKEVSAGHFRAEFRERFNIGSFENPVCPASYWGSLYAAGASIQVAELFLSSKVGFNPAGGMHHAYPANANGFCFINDPGIVISYLLNKGFKRILYIDLDAHHCDGVQHFFYRDNRVFVLSFHQSPSYAFPFVCGYLDELGDGAGFGYNLNVELPKNVADDEYLFLVKEILPAVVEHFKPEIYILALGTDALEEDYLSKLSLSNFALLETFRFVNQLLGSGIYLGGGGYNPISTLRAWAVLWCEMTKKEIPRALNDKALAILQSLEFTDFDERGFDHLFSGLLDKPRNGGIRPQVRDILSKTLRAFFNASY